MYQDQPVITSPIPHALLLCILIPNSVTDQNDLTQVNQEADLFERFSQGTFENCNHNYSISILNKKLTTTTTAAISSEQQADVNNKKVYTVILYSGSHVTKLISSKTVTVCKTPPGESFNSKNIPLHSSSHLQHFAEKRRYVYWYYFK
jgi:hypothetical protein